MSTPFRGARLKIERARAHIWDLVRQAQEFAETHPHTVSIDPDPDTGDDVLHISPAESLPEEFVLILGDAIHNLRSALDHAWCPMVNPQTQWTKFPMQQTKQSFDGILDELKDRVSEKVKRFLKDSVQPYHGGKGEILLRLHQLDIEDKHRLLITHREYTHFVGMTAVDDKGEHFWIDDWSIVPPDRASQPFAGHRRFRITDYGTARLRVTFGEGMPLQGEFVLVMLHKLTELVSRVVDRFEQIYFDAT